MARWELHESRGLGKEGRLWKLETKGLTVGRTSECDIRILSQTVETRHSVFEWNHKEEAYVVRDLGSVNGTFVNGLLLRSGVTVLHHGDTIRFGYEKDQIFCVKIIEAPPPSPTPPLPPPAVLPSPLSHGHPPHFTPTAVSHTAPTPAETSTPMVQPPQVSGVQFVPVPSAAPTIIMQPGMPYIVPQIYNPQLPQIPLASHMTPHMTGHVPPYMTPIPGHMSPVVPHMCGHMSPVVPHMTGHTSPVAPHMSGHTSPAPYTMSCDMIGHVSPHTMSQMSSRGTPPAQRTTASSENEFPATPTALPSQADREDQSATRNMPPQASSPRRDGRRSVSLTNAPNLSKTSSLYGQPAWWGEEDPVGGRSDEVIHHEPQVLRDISPERPRSHYDSSLISSSTKKTRENGSSVGRSKPGKQETRSHPKHIGSGQSKSTTPNSAWTVEVGGRPRVSRAAPPTQRHPRSADSSPVRKVRGERRSMSPNKYSAQKEASARKEASPLSWRVTPNKPPSGSLRKSGRKRSPLSSTVKSALKPSGPGVEREIEKKLPLADASSKTQQQPHASVPTPNTGLLKSQSEPSLGSQGMDKTFTVQSPADKEEEEEEERPNSARRQWTHESTQPPNSLMLASIEARMRRLSKMAQDTCLSLSAIKQVLLPPEHLTPTGPQPQACASPVLPISQEQQLPEWKFFNKEVDSIFQSIRSVERWLGDIDVTVAALSSHQGGTDGDGEMLDEIDYPNIVYTSSDNGDEQYPDSVEDLSSD